MNLSTFTQPPEKYKRTIDPVGDYVDQTAHFLNISTGRPIEECIAFAKKKLQDNTFPKVCDPAIRYYERQENGDRVAVVGTLNGYIRTSIAEKNIIAPSFTTYINPDIKESLLVSYIDDNVRARSKAKKAMFVAKAAKDHVVETIMNTEQTNRKLSNNAISGAHVSRSTPLSNKTAHSSLTSNCRSTSGYGNANNEKLVTGNRHYRNSEVTINNIVSIVTHTDYIKFEKMMSKYKLHYPETLEVMDCISYSSNLYWRDDVAMKRIFELVDKLTPIQKAAFIYTGDFYQVRKYNHNFMWLFIDKISTKKFKDDSITDVLAVLKSSSEDQLYLAHQICSEELRGKGKVYSDFTDKNALNVLSATVKNVKNVVDEYFDFLNTLLVTDNMPSSVAYFPESIRRSAITSDTDSTIFTVEDWVLWFTGDLKFNNKSMSVATSMLYLASQGIVHILAQMSANFGIQKKRLYQIAMKNEFTFDVFVPTSVAKHYFAAISCQEGIVFDKHKYEIKGVHLKSSNAPKRIISKAASMMEDILETIYAGEKISILNILKQVGDVERDIYTSIKNGDLEFFRLANIQKPDAYVKSEESSPYGYHLFWNRTLGRKYGAVGEPPYAAIRVSTTLENKTATNKWLAEMKDKDLSKNLSDWFEELGKDKLPSMLLPIEAIREKGIPDEIMDIIDIRKIVANLCRIFYMILETLGFYTANDDNTKLVSDFY